MDACFCRVLTTEEVGKLSEFRVATAWFLADKTAREPVLAKYFLTPDSSAWSSSSFVARAHMLMAEVYWRLRLLQAIERFFENGLQQVFMDC